MAKKVTSVEMTTTAMSPYKNLAMRLLVMMRGRATQMETFISPVDRMFCACAMMLHRIA